MSDIELLTQFRALIRQSDINEVSMNDDFLLSFIRARKLDVSRALSLLINYLKMSHNYPELMISIRQPSIQHVMDLKHFFVSSRRDRNGRRILFTKSGHWDIKLCSLDDVFRALVFCLQRIASEEETQRKGLVVVCDMKNLTLRQVRHVTPSYGKKVADLISNVFPLRFHGIHIINEPWVCKILMSVIWPFLSAKIRNRFFFHGECMATLHQQVDPACLPSDYDGWLGPLDELCFTQVFPSIKDCPNIFDHVV